VRIASVVGARPQFIKAAQVSREIRKEHEEILIHTGQHYDDAMSAVFFRELEIPEPDYNLGVGSASHGVQTGEMLIATERVLMEEEPDAVLVYGDTNSTLAGALAAAKLLIPLGHVEAGLRSYDRSMPEEVNRVMTDHLSDLLLCPTKRSVENLEREDITKGVHLVGDVMYDAAIRGEGKARKRGMAKELGLEEGAYALVTVHRPANADDPGRLGAIVSALEDYGGEVAFPVHPRTKKNLEAFGLWEPLGGAVNVIEPVSYVEFQSLLLTAEVVATDSGGVQKEAYFFGVPCVTLREETEWVETVEDGWNVLVGADREKIVDALTNFRPTGERGESYGKGDAARRISETLTGLLDPSRVES
jgi:UDP-N-acetylglucosamine 2-epimerase (non-hydrolysing)